MSVLSKYWKALLAALLAAAAAFLYFNVYKTEKLEYESKAQNMRIMIQSAQHTIQENQPYTDYQDEISAEVEKLADSRLDLYNHLPVDVKQEDQIMYILYLESVFGNEISFEFSEPVPVDTEDLPNGLLYDGSVLKSVDLIVNYHSTYKGFQKMINYLAQDSRVVSIDKANIKYYPTQDLAIGYLKIKLYLLDTSNSVDEEIRQYVAPIEQIINVPESGKDNIFDNSYDQPTKEVPTVKEDPTRDDLKTGGGSDLDSKVWVTQHNNKYHSRYACEYLYGPVEVVFSEALEAGVQPCEKCFATSGATELESTASTKEKVYGEVDEEVSEILNDTGVTGVGQGTEQWVYIPISGAKRYHKNSSCETLDASYKAALSEAIEAGYKRCNNCYQVE